MKTLFVVVIVTILFVIGYFIWFQMGDEDAQTVSPWVPTIVTVQPVELDYRVSSIESGGYSGTAFCNIINQANYILQNNLITVNGNGPYPIKINLMKNTFSPNEYPNVTLLTHIRFENKDNSYADTLYFGNDGNLYVCYGGK